jgi:DNA modification methylase
VTDLRHRDAKRRSPIEAASTGLELLTLPRLDFPVMTEPTQGWEIAVTDVLVALRALPRSSVHCIVTSPPYWGLRDYGVKGQIGLEPHPDVWLKKMIEVGFELHRVLRDDGTLWVNCGDAYAASGKGGTGFLFRQYLGTKISVENQRRRPVRGLKEKDLIGLPYMLAFAYRDVIGFYWRSDNVWHKPNPMPESVRDRCTRAHELVLHFAKSSEYFYDKDAAREPYTESSLSRRKYASGADVPVRRAEHQPGSEGKSVVETPNLYAANPLGRNKTSVWSINSEPFKGGHFATFPTELVDPIVKLGTSERGVCPCCGAPWKRIIAKKKTAASEAWKKASGADAAGEYTGTSAKHATLEPAPFANGEQKVQNPSEVKARILAGMVERRTVGWKPSCGCSPVATITGDRCGCTIPTAVRLDFLTPIRACADPTCSHPLESHGRDAGHCGRCPCRVFRFGDPYAPIAATVLDPFSGAATTGMVARRLGRRYLGIELNPKYAAMSVQRLEDDALTRDFGEKPKDEKERATMKQQMKLFEGA